MKRDSISRLERTGTAERMLALYMEKRNFDSCISVCFNTSTVCFVLGLCITALAQTRIPNC